MAVTIVEGFLRFEFDDRWLVVKYDEHRDYRERIGRLPDTKAMDFAAILDGSMLFFVEVKDFRGYRIQNRERMQDGELAVEVAQKVRDTIAGIIAPHHRGATEEWTQFNRCLTSPLHPARVLLWLEEDLPAVPRGRRPNQASVLIDRLKQHLRWMTPRVLVTGSRIGPAPYGLTVSSLPGAGRGP